MITIPTLAEVREGVRHFFGTKGHPRSLSAPLRPAPRAVVSVNQVHGTDALVLDHPVKVGQAVSGRYDVLVTNQPGVLLTVRTADCVPVLIHDPEHRVIAALHAGWRGVVDGIVPRTLSVLWERFESHPIRLRIGIGPAIGPCCYEVDQPVLSRLRAGFSDWPRVMLESRAGRAMLDLQEVIRLQFRSAGVDMDKIRMVRICTACHPDLFYSYRREGAVNGSMISGIMLTARGLQSLERSGRIARSRRNDFLL